MAQQNASINLFASKVQESTIANVSASGNIVATLDSKFSVFAQSIEQVTRAIMDMTTTVANTAAHTNSQQQQLLHQQLTGKSEEKK